jgi:hypothetical protein
MGRDADGTEEFTRLLLLKRGKHEDPLSRPFAKVWQKKGKMIIIHSQRQVHWPRSEISFGETGGKYQVHTVRHRENFTRACDQMGISV